MESVDTFEVVNKQLSEYYLRHGWVQSAVWKPDERRLTAIVDLHEVLSPAWRFPQYTDGPRIGYETTEAR